MSYSADFSGGGKLSGTFYRPEGRQLFQVHFFGMQLACNLVQ